MYNSDSITHVYTRRMCQTNKILLSLDLTISLTESYRLIIEFEATT